MRRSTRRGARLALGRRRVRRALRDPGPARARGHGHGLPGVRPRARRDRRDQGAPARHGARVGARGAALPLGDPPGAPRPAQERLLGVRRRRGPRPALHLHGARGGGEPGAGRARDRRAAPRRGLERRAAGRRRSRRDPRGGRRAPRPEDGQPDARPEGRRARDGLRHRQAARGERGRHGDGHRQPDGDARVHEPGAAARRGRGLPRRPLLARRRDLRAVHRRASRSGATRRSPRSCASSTTLPFLDLPQLPGPLRPVLARALAKSPADRYPTADEMRRALQAACALSAPGILPGPGTGPGESGPEAETRPVADGRGAAADRPDGARSGGRSRCSPCIS